MASVAGTEPAGQAGTAGQAVASPTPTADEVVGFGGTLEEAIDMGLYEPPPALMWNRWHLWRTATASRPGSLRIGQAGGREARIWRRVMVHFHGPEWRAAADAIDDERDGVRNRQTPFSFARVAPRGASLLLRDQTNKPTQ